MSFDILLPSHISFKHFVNDEEKIFMSSFKIHHIYLVACSSCLVPRRHSRCESGGRAGEKGRGKEARRLADNVFKMVECLMADDYIIFQKRVRGFHQGPNARNTTTPQAEWFYCFRAFGNLMKPEARVLEITFSTKKISLNYHFNKVVNPTIIFET